MIFCSFISRGGPVFIIRQPTSHRAVESEEKHKPQWNQLYTLKSAKSKGRKIKKKVIKNNEIHSIKEAVTGV